jgi:hypothetical protein
MGYQPGLDGLRAISVIAVIIYHAGYLDGCSVWDEGRVVSKRSFSNNFAYCNGRVDQWSTAVNGAEVALVVIGAWDVFDLALDVDGVETVIPFASAE